MTLPRYPAYRDSGVEWLGEVPAHWGLLRARRLFLIRKEIAGVDGVQILSVTQSGVKPKDIASNDGQISLDYTKYQYVNPGEFVMNHMDLLTGYVDISEYEGVTSPDYRVFRLHCDRKNSRRYFLYLFQRGYSQRIFYAYGQGASQLGRWRLPTDAFNELPFPVPSYEEQTAIAAFLDRETAKIDGLVREQERLIELLAEKRRAVVSHAVTKGLDPNAPMKDSGIDWLGKVPAHWRSVQLGRLCRQVSDGPHFSPDYYDDGIMFLSARNVKVDGWSLEDAKFISLEAYTEFNRRVIPEVGDILYTKGGTTGIARVVDLDFPFQVWVHIAVLKLFDDLADANYVSYSLNGVGCYEQSQLFTRGATNNDLGLTRMIKIWLALPPLTEQGAIVAYLDRETAKLDILKAEAERAVALLKERRAALISAAVTGKIDVRGRVEEAA